MISANNLQSLHNEELLQHNDMGEIEGNGYGGKQGCIDDGTCKQLPSQHLPVYIFTMRYA